MSALLIDTSVHEFHDGISFPEFDNIDRSIILFDSEDILEGHAEEMTENDPVHSAMGNDRYVLFGMSR
jgi:hypothetical protein